MPIPEAHLHRLEENLMAQERWLSTLRRHISGLQDEVSAYENILALGRDQGLLRVLEDLYDRPELFEAAADDPRAFFADRGVLAPHDATITVKTMTVNRAPRRYAVEAWFAAETLRYGVGWSPRTGFYALTDSPGSDLADEKAPT
jgi:hypothetical protein